MSRLLRLGVCLAALAVLIVPEVIRYLYSPAPSRVDSVVTKDDCVVLQAAHAGSGGMFTDVTDDVRLDFQHVVGPLGTFFVPEINGAGAALFDYDGDGDLDILMVNSGRSPRAQGDFPPGTRPESRMFRQEADGRFTDVTSESGLGSTGYGCGCAVADVDNDGDQDVYITDYRADRLYVNNGDGSFRDVSAQAGIDESRWGTCASFVDYDRDGWLDLVVSNYTADSFYGHAVGCGFPDGRVSYCGPLKFQPEKTHLFRNEGLVADASGHHVVHFRDVTESAGMASALGAGFGVVCADFTEDGWPDIYVANDEYPNRLWINRCDGTFGDEGIGRGAAFNRVGMVEAGMGLAVGDLDNDGDFDLVSTHLTTETSTVYRNSGQGYFLDTTRESGLEVTRRHTGWGGALVDLDHDGDLDLPLANGFVVPCHLNFSPHGEEAFQAVRQHIEDPAAFWAAYHDRNQVLLNNGQGVFTDASESGGDFTSRAASARGLAYGDLDNDGDIDLVVTNCGEKARVYRNDSEKRGHWISIRAVDPRFSRDAIGAVVTVVSGTSRWRGLVHADSSYLVSNDIRVHFGLGDREQFDGIEVRWPDGKSESFPGGPSDRFLLLRRGEGMARESGAVSIGPLRDADDSLYASNDVPMTPGR